MLIRGFRLPVGARRQRFLHTVEKIAKPPTHLKAWQEDAIQACLNAVHAGRTKIGVQMARDHRTTLAALMECMLQNLNAKQILVVAASGQERMADKIWQYHPHMTAEIYHKQVRTISNADVFFTSYNNIVRDEKRAAKNIRDKEKGVKISATKKMEIFVPRYDKSAVKVVILNDADEFKGIPFDEFLPLLRGPRDADELPPLPIIIATSTNDSVNALRRLEFIEDVVYHRTFLEELKETWESKALFYAIPSQLGLRKVKLKAGTQFSTGGISKVMRQPFVLKQLIQEWQERASTRKSTLVYCVDDIHTKRLIGAFREIGVEARDLPEALAEANPGTPERSLCEAQMAAFAAREFPVLLVSHKKHDDFPGLDCVLMAAPAIKREDLQNMMSSGMKSSPDKENCLVIEMVDSNFKRCPAYSISTLFQLEPLDINEQPPDILQELSVKIARIALETTPVKLKVQLPPPKAVEMLPIGEDGPLRKQANEEDADPTLRALNKFFTKRHWVLCARGVYVHDCSSRGHALLRQVNYEGQILYEAYWTTRRLLEGTHPRDSDTSTEAKKISVPGDLEDILHQLSGFLGPRAISRPNYRKLKATELQLATLRELCPEETMSHVVFEGQPMAREAFYDWLTIGNASDAIARLRYRTEPDLPPFSYAEQEDIVKRIRENQVPGEQSAKKKAAREALRERRRAEHEKHLQDQIRKKDRRAEMSALRAKELEMQGGEAEATATEAALSVAEAAHVETENGVTASVEGNDGETPREEGESVEAADAEAAQVETESGETAPLAESGKGDDGEAVLVETEKEQDGEAEEGKQGVDETGILHNNKAG
ncbi:hypothetical protein K438DRAFT_1966227 [Mycena galopus ATCC 62051]|nr:hypothetical protein K438DRAFT_1966227 [Mycena galopus ATCC 62051]